MDKTPRLTVGKLVELIQDVVESNFVTVTVEGELSNFSTPASGHWYFTLKDARAQLRGVMFRGRNRQVKAPLKDGMQVVCTGAVSIYPARGEMQLVVETLAPAGVGDLQAAFDALKQQLASEGLFAEERKQSLPAFPRCVGIVTSATGAALQDILKVLKRRAPGLRTLVRPVRVQGEEAAGEIVEAIAELNAHAEADVLIVGRGGGSLEDLWAFNEEIVARAIASSKIPVVSAVGHEVDFTIADFVADLRAPTPSAAAELVAKSRLELEAHLDHLIIRLQSRLQQSVALVTQRLEQYDSRLQLAARDLLSSERDVNELTRRLRSAMQLRLQQSVDRLAQQAGRLDLLSPLRQMARGYVVASREKAGKSLGTAADLISGDRLWLQFSDATVKTIIEEIEE